MQLKKMLRQYKNLILMGSIAVGSLVGMLVGVVPLAQKTVSLWQEVTALSSDVTLLSGKASILQLVDEDELRTNVLTLATAVPPDKSLATILTTLDTVSGQSGVAMSDFSLTKPGSIATASAKRLTSDEAKIGANLLPFSVSGVGTFDKVRSFLASVTRVRRVFRIRAFQLTNSGSLTNVHVDLDAIYLPYPTTVGSVTAVSNMTAAEEKTISSVGSLPLASQTSQASASGSVPSGKTDPFSP